MMPAMYMNYITIVPIVTMNNGQMQRTQSVLMQNAAG